MIETVFFQEACWKKDGKLYLYYSAVRYLKEDAVWTDRSRVFAGIKDHKLVSVTPKLEGKYGLDIYVSENLIEVFVNGGQYVISNVVYGLGNEIQGHVESMYISG